MTPINLASKLDNEEIVKLLLKNGSDPLICDKEGYNSLTYAVYNDNLDMLKLFQLSHIFSPLFHQWNLFEMSFFHPYRCLKYFMSNGCKISMIEDKELFLKDLIEVIIESSDSESDRKITYSFVSSHYYSRKSPERL